MNKAQKWQSFEKLYLAYDSTGLFDHQLPVMLAEFGSLEESDRQFRWYQEAFKNIETNYHEIRGLVLFNEAEDENIPYYHVQSRAALDWSLRRKKEILTELDSRLSNKVAIKVEPMPGEAPTKSLTSAAKKLSSQFKHGVNFHKGKDWKGNYDELSMRTALKDFNRIKELGADLVKWSGPGIYDRNALKACEAKGLGMMYSFWIPDHLDYLDDDQLNELEAKILKTVKEHRNNSNIIAWNIGNESWQKLYESYPKHQLFYQQNAYISWMGELVSEIRTLDTSRSVTIDAGLNQDVQSQLSYLGMHLPGVSAFGIRIGIEDSLNLKLLDSIDQAYFVSAVSVSNSTSLPEVLTFIEHYKDQRTANYASLLGLLDINGYCKPEYFKLKELWTGVTTGNLNRDIRIVTPARPIFAFQKLKYHVVLRNEKGKWNMVDHKIMGESRFSWYLVRTDQYGNFLEIKNKGFGPVTKIEIPEDYENYRIYLSLSQGNRAWSVISKLNRPYLTDLDERSQSSL